MKIPPLAKAVLFGALTSIALDCATAAEQGGEWLRVPNSWLISHFVRPENVPAQTYRVALALPAGASLRDAKCRIAQSCGIDEIDALACDYARDSVRHNRQLSGLLKAKELYFQLTLTPPALSLKLRTDAGRKPVPPNEELYTPTSEYIYSKYPGQVPDRNTKGEVVVFFPAQGGYAEAALISKSTNSPAVDSYFLHNAVLNWQTTRKAGKGSLLRREFGFRGPTRSESILDF